MTCVCFQATLPNNCAQKTRDLMKKEVREKGVMWSCFLACRYVFAQVDSCMKQLLELQQQKDGGNSLNMLLVHVVGGTRYRRTCMSSRSKKSTTDATPSRQPSRRPGDVRTDSGFSMVLRETISVTPFALKRKMIWKTSD